jgi:hypothetical protein
MNVHASILGGTELCAFRATCTKVLAVGQNARHMSDAAAEIAELAARWIVEDGLEFGSAKRRAAKQLGVSSRVSLPSNEVLEDAVRDYISVFCPDSQATELLALRRLALIWMERMQAFRPHLTGAVWRGTATRHTDICLQLFCDDCKSAELALIDHGVSYATGSSTGFHGDLVNTLSIHARCAELNEEIGVHLMVYDYDDIRGALRADAQGKSPRGDRDAVKRLLEGGTL